MPSGRIKLNNLHPIFTHYKFTLAAFKSLSPCDHTQTPPGTLKTLLSCGKWHTRRFPYNAAPGQAFHYGIYHAKRHQKIKLNNLLQS